MTILAAIGDDDADERVVSTAYDLARTYDDRLLAVHAISVEDFEAHERTMEQSPHIEDFSIEDERENAADLAREAVTDTLESFDEDRVEFVGRVGDSAEEVTAAVAEHDPRYLVVGGKRRSPVGKAIFGSTTQSLLLSVDCPVVTVMVE